MMEYNIIISGIGGQGVLTVARILGEAALYSGIKVRMSEVHGLSQRFGSLFAHVRMGDQVYGGLVPMGKGNMLLALEPAESLRYMHYMKKGGALVLNKNPIEPPQVSMGLFNYPNLLKIKDIATEKFGLRVIEVDAKKIAAEAGGELAQNSAMLGAALEIPGFPLTREAIVYAVRKVISSRYAHINIKAIDLGSEETKKIVAAIF
jgi:indolepyruvate ferredoxin oxidoreductase beta subunit